MTTQNEEEFSIRIARSESDAIAASRIYALSWKAAYRGILPDALLDNLPLDFWVGMFTKNFSTHRYEVAILSAGGADVGAGACGKSREYDDPAWGEVSSIYFLPEYWGKGYAAGLMSFMVGRLKEKGFAKVHLWVLKENLRAQKFYEKYGFRPTGSEKIVAVQGEEALDMEYAMDIV